MKLNQIIVEVEDLERALIKIRVQSGKPDDVNKAQNEAEVGLSSSSYLLSLRSLRPRLHGNGSMWNRTRTVRIGLAFTRELMEPFHTELLAVPE